MTSTNRPTALVTGASSGIGACLARELARDGHDLILAARRLEPMQILARELESYGARATVLAADLSKVDAAASLVRDIQERQLAIDVLVNNSGLGDSGRFDESDPLRMKEMLLVNMAALTELTRLLLPDMLARRRGRVMLVASTAAFQPGPQMAVYCATKAYALSLGEAIAFELRGTGVTITTLCPGATATEFSSVARLDNSALFRGSVPVMSPEQVARAAYRGLKAGRRVVIPGLLNKISAVMGRVMPRFLVLPVASSLMRPPS